MITAIRPTTTRDLRPSERIFLDAMGLLGFGRFESIPIKRGEFVLDPWPRTIRHVRFGASDPGFHKELCVEFKLRRQAADLFEFVRAVDFGEIRTLEIKSGLPFSMEIVHSPLNPQVVAGE